MFVLLSLVWVNGKTGFDWRKTYESWNDMSRNKDSNEDHLKIPESFQDGHPPSLLTGCS
jgi:hypothetical protein